MTNSTEKSNLPIWKEPVDNTNTLFDNISVNGILKSDSNGIPTPPDPETPRGKIFAAATRLLPGLLPLLPV